ncbi:MAG: hypothetical protein AB8B87_01765 [Granulosicoccus sp.]
MQMTLIIMNVLALFTQASGYLYAALSSIWLSLSALFCHEAANEHHRQGSLY